jgi:hypothetical protein
MSRKITTVAERIDQMLAAYAELDHEAHELFDLHVAEICAEFPSTPFRSAETA